MAFNASHKPNCAINRKSCMANCTCGSTEKWLRQRKDQLKTELTTANRENEKLRKTLERPSNECKSSFCHNIIDANFCPACRKLWES